MTCGNLSSACNTNTCLPQLSLTVDWEEDDDFPYEAPPTGDHCEVCSTQHWLLKHGIESEE